MICAFSWDTVEEEEDVDVDVGDRVESEEDNAGDVVAPNRGADEEAGVDALEGDDDLMRRNMPRKICRGGVVEADMGMERWCVFYCLDCEKALAKYLLATIFKHDA